MDFGNFGRMFGVARVKGVERDSVFLYVDIANKRTGQTPHSRTLRCSKKTIHPPLNPIPYHPKEN